MSEYTPTPWRVCDSHPQRAAIYIKPEEGWGEIAVLYGGCDDNEVKDKAGVWQNDPVRMANAAFICKAVNSHDALKASLAETVGIYWGDGDGIEPPPACIQRALAVLTAIEVMS